MPIRSFWLIFLKVIGIFLLYSTISIIPSLISIPMFMGLDFTNGSAIIPFFGLVVALVFFGLMVYLLLFKTGYVIDLLHLDEGFEEDELDLDIQLISVLQIAVIVTGGVMIVNGLPSLIKAIVEFMAKSQFVGSGFNAGWTLYYIAQLVLGYLLIAHSQAVVDFIERRTRDDSKNKHVDDDVLDSEEFGS